MLSSLHLEAFACVARQLNFTKAAKSMHITQSALSQRVSNLEQELGTTLLIREPKRIHLTASGIQLLKYCQILEALEEEVKDKISTGRDRPSGLLRIAGFSSVLRSVLMPALSPLARAWPQVHLEFSSRELADLLPMLLSGEVDIIVTTEPTKRADIHSEVLGDEFNVLVEALKGCMPGRENTYLDHDIHDQTSLKFLGKAIPKRFKREYLDDIYGILDGVKLGWGRAVVPRHLLLQDHEVKILPKGILKVPVYLQYRDLSHYSKLHYLVVKQLNAEVGPRLSARP